MRVSLELPANMPKKESTHRLAIFLLKEGLASPEDAVDKAQAQRESVWCGSVPAHLYYKQANPHPPAWAKFFAGDPVHGKLQGLRVASNGAVMLVPAGNRHFALAWGIGRHMLVPGTWEEDFGLRVTLNSLSADQIKSVDHITFDAYTLQHRAQSSRAGSCIDLGVDVDQNLVKALTGTPSDKTLAVKMSGVDALTVSALVDRSTLPDLLLRYLDRYSSLKYRDEFSWIDHIRPVLDQARIDQLDAQLVEKVRVNNAPRLWLAVPEIVEQDDIEAFSYRQGPRATRFHELGLGEFLATVRDPAAIDLAGLKSRQVYGHRTSVPGHPKAWSVYRCLYCEIDVGPDTFLLYDGKWYRITRDFVTAINAQVASCVVASSLPAFITAVHKSEGGYNAAVAASRPDLLHLDCDLILHGGGQSKVEICDLFGLDRRFVHVKRGTESPTLSHLFSQGEVPARCLIQDKQFREKVIDKLSGAHQNLIDHDGITPSEFTVVFAIVNEKAKPLVDVLPFFSRITFTRVASALKTYGYKVELMSIDVAVASQPNVAAIAASQLVVASVAPGS